MSDNTIAMCVISFVTPSIIQRIRESLTSGSDDAMLSYDAGCCNDKVEKLCKMQVDER